MANRHLFKNGEKDPMWITGEEKQVEIFLIITTH